MSHIEAPGLYRILTYRAATTGADGLNAINTRLLNQGAVVMVVNALYRLDKNSTAFADGVYVVAPVNSPGRWNLIAGAGAGLGWVPNIAALVVLPVTSPYLVWVETLECFWHRNPTSTAGVDGITVAPAVGGGRWERVTSSTSLRWLSQENWYVSDTGDDENPGTLALPLATIEEVSRRISVGPIAQDTTVWLLAGTTVTQANISVDGGGQGRTFTIRSVYTYNVADVVSSWTPLDHVTPAGNLIAGTAILDFTAYVGRRLRFTSGDANGEITWVGSVTRGGSSAGEALVGFLSGVPAPDDTFVLDNLTASIGRLEVRCRDDATAVVVRDLILNKVSATATAHGQWVTPDGDNAGKVVIYQCLLQASYLTDMGVVVDGAGVDGGGNGTQSYIPILYRDCCFDGVGNPGADDAFLDLRHNTCLVRCVLIAGVSTRILEGSYFDLDSNLFQHEISITAPGSLVDVHENQVFAGAVGGFSCVNCTVDVLDDISGETQSNPLDAGANCRFTWPTNHVPNIDNTFFGTNEISTIGGFLLWATAAYDTDEQKGIATLVAGTVTVAARNANTRGVLHSRNTPLGDLGDLSAPEASRTATEFVINSTSATDVSTVDWLIPGYVGSTVVGPREQVGQEPV